jgi:acyl-CoA synthetase (AMP-forming)/AMP-acid ligase II
MSTPKNNYSTVVDLLRDRASYQPEQTLYTFLADGESESGRLTYQELETQARAIAAQLQSLVKPGSRALVVYPYPAGLEFVAAFLGCLYAGVVAVTDNPPRHGKSLMKLQERVISSQATIALTTQDLLTSIKEQLAKNPELAPHLTQIPWVATDEVPASCAADWSEPKIDSDTLAFLQYTSGSTGTPKGVMVTHGNILHNSEVIYQSFEHSPNSRILIWLPLYHDMGLIGGVMQPLYSGGRTVLMSPVSLIQKPLRWLQGISRYQINSSGGPNFAYDLLCRLITPEQRETLDLSSWDVAFSGAEPVRAETLERFTTLFEPCGFRREAFYPCYGMAETTLFISGGYKTDRSIVHYLDSPALEQNRVDAIEASQPGARAIVGCGRAWLEDRIIIVNPEDFTQCPDDRVGEIWVAGAGVGKGYWNQAEETERTFQAYLADTGEGPFMRTGDLGYLHDGDVFITGRLKDLMILWGRNHYPQHIELTVEKSHPALRPNCGAAFSAELAGEERLVIVYEIERTALRSLVVDEVVGAIRQAVAEEHIADVYAVLLVKTGNIPKTSSGKIQRRLCRTKFLEGSFESVGEWRNLQPEGSNISDLGLGDD